MALAQNADSLKTRQHQITREQRKAEIKEQRRITTFSLTNIGMEVIQPTFRNDFKLDGFMSGPVMNYMGFMEIGFLRGTAVKENNHIVTAQASTYFMGFKYNHILLRSRSLNFGPSLGLRFNLSTLKDPFIPETDSESNTFGVGLYGGGFVKLGPVTISAKMHLEGNINFNRGSSFKGLSIYPSVGIAFSPMQILMNPTEFTHTAMAHWETDYETTVRKYQEYKGYGNVYDVTEYTTTWTDNYGNKTMSCKDMQPFFFIGPRIAASTTHFLKNNLISSYGANIGYRSGALFLNGFYEKSNIHFNEPFTRSTDTAALNSNVFAPRLDGEFSKSNKYGAQIGVELINWIQSKDFIYKESRVKKATAFTSIILFAGYGRVNFGSLNFNSDSGRVAYESYLLQNPNSTSTSFENVLLTAKNSSFYNFGVQFGFGAIALNVEYSLYANSYKPMNNWNVGLSYNLPVIRMARALKAGNLKRKLRQMQ